MTLAGLISDTHGLLRPQVAAALSGVSRILHAGDIGKPEILDALALIAPVTAVRGNNNSGCWAMDLPLETALTIADHSVRMRHIPDEFELDPAAKKPSVVVLGHTHRPLIERRDGILYVNPGSAGPRRFSLPISIAFLRLAQNKPPESWVQIFDL